MKCSLGISNFLEEISSLSHSIVFLYFFALIAEEGFVFSPCYSLELCTQMGIPFIFFFARSLENASGTVVSTWGMYLLQICVEIEYYFMFYLWPTWEVNKAI